MAMDSVPADRSDPTQFSSCSSEVSAQRFGSQNVSTGFNVVELEVLVREDRAAIDGFSPRPVAVCEIASLDHESWDDPVECRSLVPQRLAGLGHSFLPCAKCSEILCKKTERYTWTVVSDPTNNSQEKQ